MLLHLRLNLRAEIRVKFFVMWLRPSVLTVHDCKGITCRTNYCTRIILQVVLMWCHCSVGSKHMPSWRHEIDCTLMECCWINSSTSSHDGRPCVSSTQKFYAAARLMMRQAVLIVAVRLIMNDTYGLYGSQSHTRLSLGLRFLIGIRKFHTSATSKLTICSVTSCCLLRTRIA